MTPFVLAMSIYWPAVWAGMLAGAALVVFTIFRRRGFRGRGRGRWWKLPLALALIAGPYLADVARTRAADMGESWINAAIPTTLLLEAMQPDTHWPYAIVFNRLHRAPQRHAMWGWQLDRLATWCQTCIASQDAAMGKRGVQIAATLAGRGRDDAILVLGRALMHGDPAVALLACDSLAGQGDRAMPARPLIEAAAANASVGEVRRRAAEMIERLGAGAVPQE